MGNTEQKQQPELAEAEPPKPFGGQEANKNPPAQLPMSPTSLKAQSHLQTCITNLLQRSEIQIGYYNLC
jgi:hypothetical protein